MPQQASPLRPDPVNRQIRSPPGWGVSVARVTQIESGDVSTQDVLNRFVTALGGALKLIAFGGEQPKIA